MTDQGKDSKALPPSQDEEKKKAGGNSGDGFF
jgi:hypothetical protein